MTQNLGSFNQTRRAFLQTSALGTTVMATGLSSPVLAQSKPKELLISAGGGDLLSSFQTAYYDDFTKETGIKISPQPWKGLAELKVIVESKSWGQADVMLMTSGEAASAQALGLSEPLDYGSIDRASLLSGAYSDNWFLINLAATLPAWNTDAVKSADVPKGWTDIFGSERKGPRGLFKNASLTLDIAALGAGIPLDKLYPLDIDAALEAMSAIRNDIVWWNTGAQSQQLLANGEVDTSMMWVNRVELLRASGKPVDYNFNQAILDGDTLVIPKGHPNKKAAMEFAAYMARPEPQARLVELIPLGPTNTEAVKIASPAAMAKTASDPKNFPLTRIQDFQWWAENSQRASDAFTKWLLG
ncbi:extracellular solute-binding protein [Agrobacterium sp. LAD9]|uniref:extracellular solute-binding protein n=1 Tax=Agrobacterium sp. LAD9 TaxID=2055153 RepID=UPI000D1FA910|nr:extracellular solute-binding protein [Agrobacterium sp. LAD9]